MRKLLVSAGLLFLAQSFSPAVVQAEETHFWLDHLKSIAEPEASPDANPSDKTHADTRLLWYQQQILQHPQQVALHIQLGQLHQSAQRWQEAASAYEQALKINPRLYPVVVQLATVKLELNEPAAALKLLDAAISQWRVNPDLYYVKGLAHQAQKQTAAARHAFGLALLLDPKHLAKEALAALSPAHENTQAVPGLKPEAQLVKAQNLFNQKQYVQVQNQLQLVLNERPDFGPAYDLFARSYEASNQNAAGANWREQLQLLESCYGENPWLLGRYFYWSGYTQQASELLERQNSCRPVAAASLLQAQLFMQRHQYDQAISLLQDSLKRWPQNTALQAVQAEAHLALNQTSQAQNLINKLLALKAVPPEAYFVQGQLHLNAGRTGAAVIALKQALSLSNRPEYRKALALAYAQAGMGKLAITELQQYLKQRPAESASLQPLIAQLNQQQKRGRY